MTNTLIISYTPREGSNTKKILDAYTKNVPENVRTTEVSLASEPPVLLDVTRTNAYIARNFMGQELTQEQQTALQPLDAYKDQVLAADTIVLAYPMYNFSLPAAVKAWFDAIIQAGDTFHYTNEGPKGKLNDKQVVIISTSGGKYEKGSETAHMEHALSLAILSFNFMGITDITTIVADGASDADHYQNTLDQAIDKAAEVAKRT